MPTMKSYCSYFTRLRTIKYKDLKGRIKGMAVCEPNIKRIEVAMPGLLHKDNLVFAITFIWLKTEVH